MNTDYLANKKLPAKVVFCLPCVETRLGVSFPRDAASRVSTKIISILPFLQLLRFASSKILHLLSSFLP